MAQTRRINPQISVLNEKNQQRKIQSNVQTMKNRVQLLRQQLQRQKDNVKKHKQLTKQTISKKIQVNKIHQWRQKDSSEQSQKMDILRKRNQELRINHDKQLQDIQKAIYLVKLDDAREVKNISMEHNKKLKEMENAFLSEQRQKKQKVVEESQIAKDKYVQYWKNKLAKVYTQQAQSIIQGSKKKQDDFKQLQRLEEEQIKLMEQINQFHTKGVESKKQYLAALSIPVKQVAEALNSSNNGSNLSMRRSMDTKVQTSGVSASESQSSRYSQSSSKVPNAQVNQDKLKIILQQLKKIDRHKIHTSR